MFVNFSTMHLMRGTRPAVLTLLAAILITCGKKEEPATAPDAGAAPIAVALAPVKQVTISKPIVSSGLISTDNESRLSFKVGGIVHQIHVKEGATVVAGQTLATLDLTEIDAQVAQAHNGVEKSRRDLERVQRLYADSAATLEQKQNAQTAFEMAEQAARIAEFNRQYATIRAAASGKVIRKFVNEGEFVGPGTPVLQVNAAGTQDWIVKIGLPDADWVQVRVGDSVRVITDAWPGVSLPGVVRTINEGADPFSGLYQAEIRVLPNTYKMASGMFARVTIQPSRQQTVWRIPVESLIEGQGQQAFVFVAQANGQQVKKLPVQVAFLRGDSAYVYAGLELVGHVVQQGAAFLTEYSKVVVSK